MRVLNDALMMLNDALMMHHFILCMQDYVPLCTIPQLSVHGEPFGSLVQNNAIGFFLMNISRYEFYSFSLIRFLICSNIATKFACEVTNCCAQRFRSYIDF